MTINSADVQVEKQEDVTVIHLGPEYESLDESLLDKIREKIQNVTQAADPPLMVIDLSHTRFFGSAFLEVLFRTWNHLKKQPGGEFAISGLTPYCAEILEVTHLDSLWSIHETVPQAVAALSARN
ncbi:STAS domain-containing protein [Calycomorphotria hydatis]|uniref:Anti-sigma factor antagonist n=1 Tax=Calycomorphotria hydatis TaxID=2528027 RepID=A0A517TC46_9PLAN|nr:STAS domain-containing protein [Calycomorphotria hydatis]QDT65940.1 Putative anti-sigma factor antagonist [Calycomorphotria hydatis]